MLKEERLEMIANLVDRKGTVRVTDIVTTLHVSDMTVRRDLSELEEVGRVTRIHGGARSKQKFQVEELSHADKKIINVHEKKEIVTKALSLIQAGDTLFLGPGTTIELLAEKIDISPLRIITNCLPVFEILSKKEKIKVYLLGGEMRDLTKSFFGEITNQSLQNINFNKLFFSANAIKGNRIMTATMEEGQTQQIALSNSQEKYLLVDTSKVGKEDFCSFYQLNKITAVVINNDKEETYKQLEYANKIIH